MRFLRARAWAAAPPCAQHGVGAHTALPRLPASPLHASLAPQDADGSLTTAGPKGFNVQHVWRYNAAANKWAVIQTIQTPNTAEGGAGKLCALGAFNNVAAWVGFCGEAGAHIVASPRGPAPGARYRAEALCICTGRPAALCPLASS